MNISSLSEYIGDFLLLLMLVGIPIYGWLRKVPVYDTFVEGAKEALPTFIRLFPFMIAMLVAVGMLRASGAFDILNHWLAPFFGKIGIPPEIVPLTLIRPFSASAATGIVADLIHSTGGNSYLSHLSVIVATTTESTFYIIAVYFGVANITKNRHVLPASILVDVVGMLSAIWITKWLLG